MLSQTASVWDQVDTQGSAYTKSAPNNEGAYDEE